LNGPLKILIVASEAMPFAKTGGLADVVGALSKSLVDIGVDARVMMPKHARIKNEHQEELETLDNLGEFRQAGPVSRRPDDDT